MDKCVFCEQPLTHDEKTVTLTQKGCEGILKASIQRQDDLSVSVDQRVHIKCRKDYTNPRVIQRDKKRSTNEEDRYESSISLRSSEPAFVYNKHCLFCGCGDSSDGRQ